MYFYFLRWPPLPHSTHRQPFPLLLRPCSKRSPRYRNARQGASLLLLRRLPLRLRSQRRPRSPHPRRRSRDIKPRTARTVAYPAQTLLQSIRLAQHEYINAFAPTAGATPSAIPSTATTTTSTHPSLPLNPKAKRDSSTAQADHLAGARWEEKASACFARNDSSGVCGACRS
jgi:hypothetical protein